MKTDLKLLALHEKLKQDIDEVKKQIGPKGDQGDVGAQGPKGDKGERGPKGEKGPSGVKGPKGDKGAEGKQGQDGASVVNAEIAADGHLVFELSNGDEIDAGDLVGLTGAGGDTYAVTRQTIKPKETYTWIDYAAGFSAIPTFLETITDGDVYQYTYGSTTLYRLVGTTEDSFYQNFSSPTLSNLVVSRGLSL